MRQLKAGINGRDLVVEDGRLVVIDGQESLAQSLQRILLSVKGAYRYNLDFGVPYFENVLGKQPDLNTVRSVFTLALRAHPAVTDVVSLDIYRTDIDTYTVKAQVKADLGLVPVEVELGEF